MIQSTRIRTTWRTLQVRKSFSRALTLQGSYTYGKAIDDADDW